VGALHLATATAIVVCTALEIAREEMIRVMHEEHSFSDMYLKFLLARSMRTQPILSISFSALARSVWRESFS